MSDLYVSRSDYHRTVEQLAVNIYRDRWEFDQIICIARGGLRVGDILSRLYDCPLAILAVSSYGGATGQVRGTITFARELTMTTPRLGHRVLLVDDLVDSGLSLQQTLRWLQDRYGEEIAEIRTAVLWYKSCSVIVPDYYVDYLPDDPWIHQPFEVYERTSPAELAAQLEQVVQ